MFIEHPARLDPRYHTHYGHSYLLASGMTHPSIMNMHGIVITGFVLIWCMPGHAVRRGQSIYSHSQAIYLKDLNFHFQLPIFASSPTYARFCL